MKKKHRRNIMGTDFFVTNENVRTWPIFLGIFAGVIWAVIWLGAIVVVLDQNKTDYPEPQISQPENQTASIQPIPRNQSREETEAAFQKLMNGN
jgi:hypothetical protein